MASKSLVRGDTRKTWYVQHVRWYMSYIHGLVQRVLAEAPHTFANNQLLMWHWRVHVHARWCVAVYVQHASGACTGCEVVHVLAHWHCPRTLRHQRCPYPIQVHRQCHIRGDICLCERGTVGFKSTVGERMSSEEYNFVASDELSICHHWKSAHRGGCKVREPTMMPFKSFTSSFSTHNSM